MELNIDEKVAKIAAKLKIRNKVEKLKVARDINQLAIMLIEIENQNEDVNIHPSFN